MTVEKFKTSDFYRQFVTIAKKFNSEKTFRQFSNNIFLQEKFLFISHVQKILFHNCCISLLMNLQPELKQKKNVTKCNKR